ADVSLVSEDASGLERMADRLVDLQHHLVRCEQHVHALGRAVRRGEELERFLRDAPAGTFAPETREDLDAPLLADAAMAVQRALLCDAVGVRGDTDRWEQEA